MTRTARALGAAAEPLRVQRVIAWVSLTLGVVLLVFAVAAWLARLEVWRGPAWVPVSWALALALVVLGSWLVRHRVRELTPAPLAEWLEQTGAWRLGSLRAHFEPGQQGTSEELRDAADELSASTVQAGARRALAPLAGRVTRELLAGAGVTLLGVLALGAARPFSGAPALLWQPVRAARAAVAPVTIAASADTVDRGRAVTFRATSFGRRDATLWLRAPGESWHAVPLALGDDGLAEHVVPALESDLFARVTSGGRESDTVHVHVRLPVFLGSVEVTARYPGYLGLEDEPLPLTGDTVLVPEGTRLEVQGEATAELASVRFEAGSSRHDLSVSGTRFEGTFVPARDATWELRVDTRTGAPVAGEPVRLPIRVQRDSAPVVEIPVPGADTTAPADRPAPIVIDARDDHGVRRVVLELRRIDRTGRADAMREQEVALPAGTADRAIVTVPVNLAQLGVAAGDTLRYRARALDNAPRGNVGRSREYVLRVLTLAEVRAESRQSAAQLQATLDSLTKASRALERQTEDLARSQPRDASRAGRSAESLTFEQARKAEAVAAAQEQLLQEAESARDQLSELEHTAEAAGLADSAFRARLDEVRRQLDDALTPEIREKLRQLRESLKELDAERTQETLKDLAKKQEELREALERSRELFRRAAMEGELKALAEESKDLAKEQQEWNDQVASADSQRASALEEQLAERADSLSSALQQLAEQVQESVKAEKLEAASQQAGQAAQQMKQAAQAAKQGKRQQAGQQGKQAQQKLEPLGEELDQQRQDMADDWREEVVQQLDRALADVSRLGERQLEVTQGFERGEPSARLRAEQGAVQEGVQRLQEQLREAAGKNALVSPQIGTALAAAERQMQRARDAVGTANPNPREGADRAGEALDALNAAAHGLLRARGDVSGSESGSGLAEAIERMGQLAQQQGQLGQEGAALLPQMGGGGAAQQLAQLAAQQRALAQELEKLRGQGNMPGAGEMANEAEEVSKRMEAGRLDSETVERQERLFRRMLDAGRTLQGEERDEQKERQSTTATDDSVRLPPALRARLADEAGQLRVPSWEELQRLSPAERRLVVDYFRRLAE